MWKVLIVACILLFTVGLVSFSRQSTHPELVIAPDPLLGCCDEACSVAFHPDRSMVAAKLYHSNFLGNHGVVIWDLSTASLIKALEGPEDGVQSIKFGVGGDRLSSSDGRVWDLLSGRTRQFGSGNRVLSNALSPDGNSVATGGGRPPTEIVLWNAETGRKRHVLASATKIGRELQFSQNGKTLVATGPAMVQLWSVRRRELIRTIGLPRDYNCFDYNEDQRLVAISFGDLGSEVIQVLSLDTGRVIGKLGGNESAIWSIALNPNGRLLASSSGDLSIKLWDIGSGIVLHTLLGHSRIVRTVVFSPDGRTVASGGGDNEVKIWSTGTGELIATFRVFKDGNWIVYTPDSYYNCSEGASKYIRWRFGRNLADEGQYRRQFRQPRVVAERLRDN